MATNHRFQFNLGPDNDRHSIELHVRIRFNYTHSKNTYESLAAEFSALDNWESLFYDPEADQSLTSILVNKVETRLRSNTTNVAGGAQASLNTYSVSFDASFDAEHNKYNSFDLYKLANAAGTDRRHRYFDRLTDHRKATAGISWRTASDPSWVWVATTRLAYDYAHDKQENSLYRLDQLKEMENADLGTLPSTREALLESLDRTNSYLTTNNRHRVTLSFDGRYDKHIYRNNNQYARFRFTWKAGVTLQNETWDFEGQQLLRDRRTAWLPSLGLEVLRNTPGMKHELELQTAYRQQLPSMFSLMGLRFDDDPLNIRQSNTNLRRTDVFSAVFFYRSGNWQSKHRRGLSATVRLYAYRIAMAMATAQTYNATTDMRTYRPENVNGNWNMSATGSFHTPIGKRDFSLNLSLSDRFYHSVDLMATNDQTPTRSTVGTNYLSLPVKLDYSHNKLRLGAHAQVAWNHTESRRKDFRNMDAADISVRLSGNVVLPWSLQLATDITCFVRRGYVNNAMNTDDFVWNAQLFKSLLHGKLTLALVGYDILGQLSNISYNVNAQGNTETWCNVIPRYAMLRVIFRFNKQPKKL